ncbi:aldehyde dehydrogenase family protein, partial [Acinetobacter baumannii]|nr:aldehyde dehydrogenase family protein [Acinetobacter baumannii]
MDISKFEIFKNLSLINGEWVAASHSQQIEVFNPVDQSIIGTIPALEPVQVSAAIQGAEQALGAWKARSVKQRSDILKKWYALIMQHCD